MMSPKPATKNAVKSFKSWYMQAVKMTMRNTRNSYSILQIILCAKYLLRTETCKSMWVTYECDQAVHFCNTTNNHLESHNQKLMDVTFHASSLSEMFQNVLLFIQTTESETSHVAFTEEFTSRCTLDTAISGIAEVQSICTQYAADLITEQMKLPLTIKYTV